MSTISTDAAFEEIPLIEIPLIDLAAETRTQVVIHHAKQYFFRKVVRFRGYGTPSGKMIGKVFRKSGEVASEGEHDEDLNLVKGTRFLRGRGFLRRLL